MSRVGEKPIGVPTGVNVSIKGRQVSVSGPKGNLDLDSPDSTEIAFDEKDRLITVKRLDDRKQSRANHGLARALVANMVEGVSKGYEKCLEIYGTGYNCKLAGRTLHLNVGFMGRRRGIGSQFELQVPDRVEVVVEKEQTRGDTDPAILFIRGYDKQAVGQFAAEIRALRKTEPYKGKGIRYRGEEVKRKQGKALSGGA